MAALRDAESILLHLLLTGSLEIFSLNLVHLLPGQHLFLQVNLEILLSFFVDGLNPVLDIFKILIDGPIVQIILPPRRFLPLLQMSKRALINFDHVLRIILILQLACNH